MARGRLCVFLLAGAALALAACAGGTVREADLLHRRFVLERVNGEAVAGLSAVPDIEFGEGLRVFGRVCNRYAGEGELLENVLTVKGMAMTKMLCPDEALNKLEYAFGKMLSNGATVEVRDGRLTLAGEGMTLSYKAAGRRE